LVTLNVTIDDDDATIDDDDATIDDEDRLNRRHQDQGAACYLTLVTAAVSIQGAACYLTSVTAVVMNQEKTTEQQRQNKRPNANVWNTPSQTITLGRPPYLTARPTRPKFTYKPDDQGYFSTEDNRFHPWIHKPKFLTANGHTTRRTIFEYLHQLWVPGTDAITIAKEKRELGCSLYAAELDLLDLHEGVRRQHWHNTLPSKRKRLN
jgi:hypothetical protein